MQGMRRLLPSHVSEERVDGSQPNVPSASAVLATAFQVIEEEPDEGSIEVFDAELGWTLVEPFWGELQKQAKGIAIARYRRGTRLPLTKQAIGEKRLKKRGGSWRKSRLHLPRDQPVGRQLKEFGHSLQVPIGIV